MKSRSEYAKQRKQARKWAIEYIKYLNKNDDLCVEMTEENIKGYARSRRQTLKQFHRLRGRMLG